MEIRPEAFNAWPKHTPAKDTAPGRSTTEAIDTPPDETAKLHDSLDMQSSLRGADQATRESQDLQEQTVTQGAQAAATTDGKGTSASSPLKSITYGILGLERPDHPEESPNAPYKTGQWIGATGKVGAVLSLLI